MIPESWGDLFVTFDTLELMNFFDDVENVFIFVFRSFSGFLATWEIAKIFSL